MKKKVMWRFILIAATIIISFIYFLPDLPIYNSMPQWWKDNMPSKGMTLGLDLQGGTHLVYEVKVDDTIKRSTNGTADAIKNMLEKKDLVADVTTDGLIIQISNAASDIASAVDSNYGPILSTVSTEGTLQYKLSDSEVDSIKDNANEQALETIRNRIDQFGVAEPSIHRQGENEIVIQLPGIKDPERAKELIGKTAQLEFKIADDNTQLSGELPAVVLPGEEDKILQDYADKVPEGDEILFIKNTNRETGAITKTPIVLRSKTLLTGDTLTEARVSIDQSFGDPNVSITFNSTGAEIFEQITRENVQKRLAIVLDGTVYSAPNINEPISGGRAQITGRFTMDEAKDLAIVLKAGALPASLELLHEFSVGPSLGRDSIDAGRLAGIIGALLVVVFMIIYYKFAGLIADFAMVLNIVLLLGAMAGLEATLTLPGLAGIILAIGMAVDSNVLMFERMREELRSGKTPRAAIDSGYDKAFWTIFDSHITTFITALVLFQFGTGPIKGFAVTLSLGVAINLFTALIGTKTLFDYIYSRREVNTLSI